MTEDALSISEIPRHLRHARIRNYYMSTDTDRFSSNPIGSYNTIKTNVFNFCRKASIVQVSVVLASDIVKIR